MKFFLFHCWGGTSKSCWSGWLEGVLRSIGSDGFGGFEVLNPDFPDTDNPKLEKWLAKARKTNKKFAPEEEWVLIGHSLGCPAILRLLETFDKTEKAKAVILVAGFAKDLNIPEIRNFVDRDFDWKKIRDSAEKFIVISSDNDPYIPLPEGERMAKLLGAEFIIEHNAGHINEGQGFDRYERLLGIIKGLQK
jgi:predicted alpha/beta hydrolase family esterase